MSKGIRLIAALTGGLVGVYGAWWVSALSIYVYSGRAVSFDDLSGVAFATFLVACTLLCPFFAWTAVRLAKRFRKSTG